MRPRDFLSETPDGTLRLHHYPDAATGPHISVRHASPRDPLSPYSMLRDRRPVSWAPVYLLPLSVVL